MVPESHQAHVDANTMEPNPRTGCIGASLTEDSRTRGNGLRIKMIELDSISFLFLLAYWLLVLFRDVNGFGFYLNPQWTPPVWGGFGHI